MHARRLLCDNKSTLGAGWAQEPIIKSGECGVEAREKAKKRH